MRTSAPAARLSRRTRLPQILLHHTGQWRLRLSGRDYYLGVDEAAAAAAAQKLIAEWIANGRKIAPRRDDERIAEGCTIDEVVIEYTQRELPKRSVSMRERIQRALLPLQERFGTLPANSFDTLRLDDLRRALLAEQLTRIEINARIGMVRSMFTWAAGMRLVDPGVAFSLSALKGLRRGQGGEEQREVMPVDLATVEATLRHVCEPVAGLIRFQWGTGARPGEACALNAAEIDRSGPTWIYRPRRHKAERFGKRRAIPIPKSLQPLLSPLILRHPGDAPLFAPADALAELRESGAAQRRTRTPPSQIARARRRARNPQREVESAYCVASYRRAIDRGVQAANTEHRRKRLIDELSRHAPTPSAAAKLEDAVSRLPGATSEAALGRLVRRVVATGLPKAMVEQVVAEVRAEPDRFQHWHPHQLRHAFAHRAEGATGDLDGVRAVLGHSSDALTRRYAHADERRAVALVERLG